MVGVVQLVERQVVILNVAGSSPVTHPNRSEGVFCPLTFYFLGGLATLCSTPIPDGTCDVTAHVAMDAVATAAGTPYELITQREALKALGLDGARPPRDLAVSDPAGYLRRLSAAGAAGELLDPAGLGGHWWLLHAVGVSTRGIIGA